MFLSILLKLNRAAGGYLAMPFKCLVGVIRMIGFRNVTNGRVYVERLGRNNEFIALKLV